MTFRRLAVLCAMGLSGAAVAADVNTLNALEVKSTGAGAVVSVQGTQAPTFTVFRLSDPDRLVVDVAGADAKAISGHHDGSGPVAGVVASSFTDQKNTIGRLLIALDKVNKYDVHAEGNRVIVSVEGGAHAEATPVAPAVPAAVAAVAPVAPNKEALNKEEGVVASRLDEQQVAHPATALTSIAWTSGQLRVRANGGLSKFEVIELANPARLAIDIYGVKSQAKAPKIKTGAVREVRVGAWAEKVRLVVDARAAMPAYDVSRTDDGLVAKFGAVPAAAKADEVAEVVIDGQPALTSETPAPAAVLTEVKDVQFDESATGGRVEIKLSGAASFKVDRPDDRSAVLTLEHAHIARLLERSFDTSALQTPVKMVSAFSVPGNSDRVRLVVASDAPMTETVVQTPAGLSWRLGSKGAAEEAQLQARTAGFASESTEFAEKGAPQKTRYVGKRVTFEFKDIDIHNLLRIISEISKKNIIVTDDVSGKVTIRLRNVPWDQALDLILRSKGLGMEDLGNILRVAPIAKLQAEEQVRADRKKLADEREELFVQLVPVNYASATDMSQRVKDSLSPRGTVSVDARTNTLIVRDIRANLGRARSLVSSLDTQTPQVLIESRIVEANTRLAREVGIQWGVQVAAASANGNSTGLAFPSTVAATGAAGNALNDGVSSTPNWAVNLPVAIGNGSGGGLGLVFGSAGGALQLNLRLSALESQGVLKTISSPKVTTLDNASAKISQGLSIPFSQVSAGGVNTSFIEARLSLEVTPHITADGSVLMNIKAENNQPDPSNSGANGQPAIQRKEATTQVIVKDSDTTVIGGILVRTASSSQSGVPVLSKIPILGFFFRNHRELETRNELLIFITPRILNRQAVAQTP